MSWVCICVNMGWAFHCAYVRPAPFEADRYYIDAEWQGVRE